MQSVLLSIALYSPDATLSFVSKFMYCTVPEVFMLVTGDFPSVLQCRDPRCCGMLHGVIWCLVTGVSGQPRWDGYVATKRWHPSTTITLSNFPKLLRSQLSRSVSFKSHTTPCRLVDKVIRIVLLWSWRKCFYRLPWFMPKASCYWWCGVNEMWVVMAHWWNGADRA